jgi:hypothetical protein
MSSIRFIVEAFAAVGFLAVVGFMSVIAVTLTQNLIMLWGSVKKYGGEKPRNLNWFGRIMQRLFQFLHGKSPNDVRGFRG